jgi:hypothetical protein
MGLINDIKSLQPEVQEKVLKLLSLCDQAGIKVTLGETLRTIETQAVYYLRGRIKDDPTARKALSILGKAHAWEFSEAETKKEVTWTLASNHLDGKAVDLRVYKPTGAVDWNSKSSRWKKVLDIARKIGFTCGADWPQNDFAHIEWRK